MDEVETPELTLNTLGHQWFWEYSIPDLTPTTYEAYIKDGATGSPRLMEVDNRTCLPSNTLIRTLISATDVIHA
jgi:cytochrome c oxidase subunit 2